MIVESPNKTKTISQILKELGYTNIVVKASVGHISRINDSGDFNMGIDPKTFDTDFRVSPDKTDIVKQLKEQVKLADKVILATDPDREGEAISWSLRKFLNIPENKYERITYHEITKEAIRKALDNPRKIDEDLVVAAHTRSRLDKIVGYRLSPVAMTLTKARSVGRCQSAGLKLVVDREKEITNFKPESYFELYLNFEKNGNKFKAKYIGDDKRDVTKLKSKKECDKVAAECKGKNYIISDVTTKELSQNAPSPFTTSTFQQEVSSKLGLGVNEAMMYAQKLFEGVDIGGKHQALITYIRTDDADIAPEFLPVLQKYIENKYGRKFYSGLKQKKKKENVQGGHECIRPVDLNITTDAVKKLVKDENLIKVYDIIYKRTVASVMSARKISDTQYTIINVKNRFSLSSKEELFPGWKLVYSYSDDKEDDVIIKESFKVGEKLLKTQLEALEKSTQPPLRYTEASLIKTLDKLGIGRPSTYGTIISTLLDTKRGYCTVEGKKLTPTVLGITLVDFLDKNFSEIVNSSYSANLEKSLDKIAAGDLKDVDFLKDFYSKLDKDINKIMPSTNKVCPECGSPLVVRKSKYGTFLGCSNYPKCRHVERLKN